ncbi:Putative carboxylesterase, type B, carboxylesterase type B, carboxylesterase type B, active [Septoria linicola]|uniref:Carboxylic ester hydrolase n=1 Tax=Septoria linicola TaxID=215465 RepID=A0A9Q9EQN3_9PEZI|nr:putative carboxylesterase, type B, carboxylesterase type B, carboxylesterase type B, active [Septoria linicola]USW58964.1 Putative carboxylesterase, type B, carboxylesterase type B, carboxylesterase type B, active [Septoria linicola]
MHIFTALSSLLIVVDAGRPRPQHDELNISTTSGRVHGKIDRHLPNVRQFLGIPFAQPPVEELRWAAPQPLSQPHKHIEATKLPPSCPQSLTETGTDVYTQDVLEFNLQGLNKTGSISEDCLTLSVWTPTQEKCSQKSKKQSKKGLPVLVYVYGGSFSTGGQDVPYQIPAQWVDRAPDHIVVSFNYRVNVFGFPGAEGLDDQNVGLLDQRLAVEWVQKNIAQFGGDPEKIVIWGQSAGAASVDFYNFAYPEDPIVTGLIMDSGTTYTGTISLPGDATGANFSYVASQVGCPDLADTPEQQLACMRKVDFRIIESFVANYSDSGTQPRLAFQPSVDDKVVFSNYTQQALEGKQAKIPAIIGTNAQDGVPFAPYRVEGPDQAAANAALLTAFVCPATETTRLRQETKRTTYRFFYAGNFTNISPRPWMGAWHSAELPLIFGTHPNYRGPSTKLEYATSHAMQDAWVAFATDPVNGLSAQDWLPYDTLGSATVREFGAGVAARDVDIASLEAQCNGPVPG